MSRILDICGIFVWYSDQMSRSPTSLLERQLLLQFGDRLKRLRQSQGIGTVEMARRAGISRTTLGAVEAGDPGPSIGTFMSVMSALGISADLALLAGETLQHGPPDAAGARFKRARPLVKIEVSADPSLHRVQDLQSLAMHEEAVRQVRADPELLSQAQDTVQRWLASDDARSRALWLEWQTILQGGQWRKVLSRSRRAQALRQASPLITVLPEAARQSVLQQVHELRRGVELGDRGDGVST
jgi:transcriptional regulator with XRE-family HTH domain